MTDLLLSDDELNSYRSRPKRVTNPGARWLEKPGRHKQRNYKVISDPAGGDRFHMYLRQNLNDEKDFSCGLALAQPGGKSVSLIRYNGSSHRHGGIAYRCHIHLATAAALRAGHRIDRIAEQTERYRTLEGTLACLIEDCGVQGLNASHDEGDLFNDS